MTREGMTEMLSETICVTTEEARSALEARDWNVLEAALLLQERARVRRAEAARVSRQGRGGSVVRDLISWFTARHAAPAETVLSASAMAPLFLMPSVYASL